MLAVSRDYHESYIPQSMPENFPQPLMNLYKLENLKKDYGQLLSLARQTDVNVTKDNIRVVETKTKNQYKSRLEWRESRPSNCIKIESRFSHRFRKFICLPCDVDLTPRVAPV